MSEYNHLSSIKIIEQGQEQHHNRKEHINLSEKECLHHDHTQQHRYHHRQHHRYHLNYYSNRQKHREPSEENHDHEFKQHTDFKRHSHVHGHSDVFNNEVDMVLNGIQNTVREEDQNNELSASGFRYRSSYVDENCKISAKGIEYGLVTEYTSEEVEAINKMLSWSNEIFSSHDHDIREGIKDNLVLSGPVPWFLGETSRVPCKSTLMPIRYMIYKYVAECACNCYNDRVGWIRYEVDEVLRVDIAFIDSYVYYITFTAKDLDAEEGALRKTLQALCKELSATHDSYDVLYANLKPDDIV